MTEIVLACYDDKECALKGDLENCYWGECARSGP